jgi:hypothetical protein
LKGLIYRPVVIVVPLIGIVVASPAWLPAAGIDVWELPAALSESANVEREAAAIATMQEEVFRSIETVDHTVSRLIEGKLTLADTADEILPLLETRPGFNGAWRQRYPGPTLRHSAARHAIDRAVSLLKHDPTHRSEVSFRLEAEYKAMK